ncbi:MAG: NAD-dependent epimerase/dehydratase family protein [Flavobacteriales bacterium]|jgi:nucleoside-diphosphate-sugar epimerase|nr:NAD-dependent epimerase/dehydratase family protein [Flavobacteriales bacterium]
MEQRVLIIGACGQIGTELTLKLRDKYGTSNVVASDLKEGTPQLMTSGLFIKIDATDKEQIRNILVEFNITQVYMMAAMLSATAEKMPLRAWDLNMTALLTILELGKEGLYKQLFWPSSIGAFGPNSPHTNTPQDTIMAPTTVYGISKYSGEMWCQYYATQYGLDVRTVRYPGIVSYKTKPGGGTTDYAVEIYFEALKSRNYTCFLSEETTLPMMYMDDAIEATLSLMAHPKLQAYKAYNISGINFNPKEIADAIKKQIPEFKIEYQPDFRQAIADSWPQSIDDSQAKADWDWQPQFDLEKMTSVMLANCKPDM